MRKSNELQIGKAGEYMVCADLILKGLIAYPSEQGLPYDVVIDNGKQLLKCQVKTTLKPRIVLQRKKETSAYIFHVKRHGKYNNSIYGLTEVDLFALVCLDTRLVGYLKNDEMPSTINLRVDSMMGQYYDEQGIVNYQKVIDLSKEIKRHSLASQPGASRIRFEKTIATSEQLSEDVFPLIIGDLRVHLNSTPESLYRGKNVGRLQVRTLSEPVVEFSHHKETPNIREGITSFGAYQDARKTIELVPICTNTLRDKMASLINRLKVGKYKYGGSERTFSTKLVYSSVITVPSPEEVLDECQRLLDEHPDWIGNTLLDKNVREAAAYSLGEIGHKAETK